MKRYGISTSAVLRLLRLEGAALRHRSMSEDEVEQVTGLDVRARAIIRALASTLTLRDASTERSRLARAACGPR